MPAFTASQFLPVTIREKLCRLRVCDPERALRAAKARKRRTSLTIDGKLVIVAADHPARRVTQMGDDPLGMADRHDYLARVLRVLMSENVDGVMATMDVLEDLLVIESLIREGGAPPLLDGKVLIASLNRGGLARSKWEMDDPITGPSPAACVPWGLDGIKLLLRICDGERGSLETLVACARAISEANAAGLPSFLEPLPVEARDGGFRVIKTKEALAQIAGVASALGDSSRYLWLKLPYCAGYETVARATSLPILLLGGESAGDVAPFLRELFAGMEAGTNVRGALAGRNVLYPGPHDPEAAGDAAGGIVHKSWTLEHGMAHVETSAGRRFPTLHKYLEKI
jgi:DhnA family fructose-bisphosphate aldolase class Ia